MSINNFITSLQYVIDGVWSRCGDLLMFFFFKYVPFLLRGNWDTVNVVIFAEGKFRENVGKTFHVGVIFTILLIFPS